ncbi:hypothetical protein RCO48_18280 [Peribacillus frigoritolerans]|nr:hypothetical protein [Peribacillus frigoritolerans]
MERKVRDSCGTSVAKGDPAGAKRRGGCGTARGKRVPGEEINDLVLMIVRNETIRTSFFRH